MGRKLPYTKQIPRPEKGRCPVMPHLAAEIVRPLSHNYAKMSVKVDSGVGEGDFRDALAMECLLEVSNKYVDGKRE